MRIAVAPCAISIRLISLVRFMTLGALGNLSMGIMATRTGHLGIMFGVCLFHLFQYTLMGLILMTRSAVLLRGVGGIGDLKRSMHRMAGQADGIRHVQNMIG